MDTNNIYDTKAHANIDWSDDLETSEIATALELIARQQLHRDSNWYILNEAAMRLRGFATA